MLASIAQWNWEDMDGTMPAELINFTRKSAVVIQR
jgi:hypothetical protein